MAGSVLGNLRDGIGGRCHYSEANDLLEIEEVGKIDGAGPMERLNPPVALKYERKSDRLFMTTAQPVLLVRVQR